jgi:hypothetical protein
MTKKHFIELADALRNGVREDLYCTADEYPARDKQGYQTTPDLLITPDEAFQVVVNRLADFCKNQNSRFDRERWLSYIAGECGPNGGKVPRNA